MDLVFRNVEVHINEKKILKDVSGVAQKGEMLAIMGPSGKSWIIIVLFIKMRIKHTLRDSMYFVINIMI